MSRPSAILAALLISASLCPGLTAERDRLAERLERVTLDRGASLPFDAPHFVIEAYGTTGAQVSKYVESAYFDFVDITGQTNFTLEKRIRLIIFKTPDEFRQRMGLKGNVPPVIASDSVIATFEKKGFEMALVGKVSDVLMDVLLGHPPRPNEQWFRRGVAQMVIARRGGEVIGDVRERLKSQLKRIRPAEAEDLEKSPRQLGQDGVKRSRQSSASLVAFLSGWGGRLNFAFFVSQLRAGHSIDDALSAAYPGKIRNFQELYGLWRTEEIGELRRPGLNRR